MAAYYNEHDKFAAAWLRELIKAGLIADGEVDERDIQDVQADDLEGFFQCHFFAGIGGWSYALRLAGWPDDRPVWTGSCPCQPFSDAGRGQGEDDSRHLWPIWFALIAKCRPSVIAGEQTAGSAGLSWLDAVCLDLEDADYAVAASDLCAACVGAPHVRQRLYWVADASSSRSQGRSFSQSRSYAESHCWQSELAGVHPVEGFQSWPDEPSDLTLAYRPPDFVGRLRGYGNAIVPQVAAAFIEAFMSAHS